MQMNKPAAILGLDFSSSALKVVGIRSRKGKLQGPVFMREIDFALEDIGYPEKEKPLMTIIKAFKENLGSKKTGLIISLPSYLVSYHQLPTKAANKTQAFKVLEEKWESISPLPKTSMDYSLNLWPKNQGNKSFVGLIDNGLTKKIRMLAQKNGLQLVGLAPQMGLLALIWSYLPEVREKDICAYVTEQSIEWSFLKDDQIRDLGYCAKQANETPLSHMSRVLKIIAYRNLISENAKLILTGPSAEVYAQEFAKENSELQNKDKAYLKVELLEAKDLLLPNMEWGMWPVYAYMLYQGKKPPLLHFQAPFVGKTWLDSPKTSQTLVKVFGLLAILLAAQAIYTVIAPNQRVSEDLVSLRQEIRKVRLERKNLEDRLLQQAGYDWKSDPGEKISNLLHLIAESLPETVWVQKIEYTPTKANVFLKGDLLEEVSGNLEGRDGITLANAEDASQIQNSNSLTIELDLTNYEPGRDQDAAEAQSEEQDNPDQENRESFTETGDQIQADQEEPNPPSKQETDQLPDEKTLEP